MKIIVIGAGKVGEALVKNFVEENHDIVVIDLDAAAVNKVVNRYDVKGIIGSGLQRDHLIESGVDSADFFIACTSRDEMNILCCVLAKRLGARKTIARVRDPELFSEKDVLRSNLGIDLCFNPEYRTAMEILQVLKFPSAKNVESFADGTAAMVEFVIGNGNPMIGMSLMEISSFGYKLLFAMVVRGDEVIIPRGDFVIHGGDTVNIIADEKELAAFCKKLKIFKPKARSAFIVGGGKVAYYLAKELLKSGVDVKIMENNRSRCDELCEELSGASVLFGDGTDQASLDEENLKGSDACVALTGMDEANVIISLYARSKKINKVVTKIDRETVSDMVQLLGLDTVVSPKKAIANHIIRFVRSHQTQEASGVNTLYKLYDKAEAAEFTVEHGFSRQGVALKDMKIKKGVLVGGVVRNGEFILPVGDTAFYTGDKVIVVTTEKQINSLEQILR